MQDIGDGSLEEAGGGRAGKRKRESTAHIFDAHLVYLWI